MEHVTCAGCHYERAAGVCADPTWIGEQMTHVGPRLCYDVRPVPEAYRIDTTKVDATASPSKEQS